MLFLGGKHCFLKICLGVGDPWTVDWRVRRAGVRRPGGYRLQIVAVSKADTKVEDVAIRTVILGDAYIARNGKTGTPARFVCLLGEKGKLLLTFFTAQ